MVLLYDGVCGFCNRAVAFVLRHDRKKTIRFAALQGAYGSSVLARHAELAGIDSVVLVDEETDAVQVRSDAVMALGRYLGGVWSLAVLGRVVPRAVRDALYDLFARYRYRLFGKLEACGLPSVEERSRFLE